MSNLLLWYNTYMDNHLTNLEEFQKILAGYQISDESKEILAETKLVAMVASSSAGRNTIIKELLKSGDYHYIVSDTTRQKRTNDGVMEQDGVEYWFRPEEEVLADLQAGKYLEAAIIHNQQVSGISIRELQRAKAEGKAALSDIEIIGMQNIIKSKPDTYPLFILPPSFDVWMQRLDKRGEMSLDEKRRRLGSAVQEFTSGLENDYYIFVINDDFHNSVKKIHGIVIEGKPSPDQASGRKLAEELRAATENWLYTN